MACRMVVDDSHWDEVRKINCYAVFMGYLMMGVKGLGILILTWTTVVLLGGFVSILEKKDFWCLTGITLVQSAGVFNIILKDAMSDVVRSGFGLLSASLVLVLKVYKDTYYTIILLCLLTSGIQALVLVIILCPVVVLYWLGIYISAGIGLVRLIKQDFENNTQAVGTHLNPALRVLYSLAVTQGAFYLYRSIYTFAAKDGIAEFVTAQYNFGHKDLVAAYLEDTVAGCEKDPSFAAGRNFVTYAVDLMMDTKSTTGFINGVKILSMAIWEGSDRQVLAKHLLTRPSCSSQTIQRLLETMGPRSPYNGEIRGQAAAILSVVASSIHLEEHPEWINCILSALGTFEEYRLQPENYEQDTCLPEDYERGWLLAEYETTYWHLKGSAVDSTTSEESTRNKLLDSYAWLAQQSFSMLGNLAIHQDNSRVIVNTAGLLPKIMAPLNSLEMHRDQHTAWHAIAMKSHKLMKQLAVIPEEEGRIYIPNEISSSREAIITTLGCIIECLECDVDRKISAVDFVFQMLANKSIEAIGTSGPIFTWILLPIFLLADQVVGEMKISSNISESAGTKKLSSNNEQTLQQSVGLVLQDLTTALMSAEDSSTRVHAAKILEFLVRWYEKDEENLNLLKNAMVHVMPQVLNGILETEAVNNPQPSLQHTVLEMGDVSGGGVARRELTKLCGTIWMRWYMYGARVTRQLDQIARQVCLNQGKPVTSYEKLVEQEMLKYPDI